MTTKCKNCKEDFIDAMVEDGLCEDCYLDLEDGGDDYYDDSDREMSYARLLNAQGMNKTCYYCGDTFLGMPDHGVCNGCADKLEQGWDLEQYDPEAVAEQERIFELEEVRREAGRAQALITNFPFTSLRNRTGLGGNGNELTEWRKTITLN